MADVNGTITLIPLLEGYDVKFENVTRQYIVETYMIAAVENMLVFMFLALRLYTKTFLTKQF